MNSTKPKSKIKLMSPSQCRAARGLSKWTQPTLADASGIGLSTLNRYENETRPPRPDAIRQLQSALETAGIELIFAGRSGGYGVRLKNR